MRTLRIKTFLTASIALLVLFGCSSPPILYSAAPLSGRVTDRETREPIIGAYVVVVYILKMGMEGGSSTPLHYEETRSDSEGRYHFDGFENKPIPYERATANATLTGEDPRIYLFAEGYRPVSYVRPIDSRTYKLTYRTSPFDGKDLSLVPLGDMSIRKESSKLRSYVNGLSGSINATAAPATLKNVSCAFSAIPQTLNYLLHMEEKFKNSGERYRSVRPSHPVDCEN